LKILLDENLPHQLRHELKGHDVFTTAYMKWAGIENGELLRIAAEDGFDVIITNDRGLEYEQNLDVLPVAVVVILARGNTIRAIRPLLPAISSALSNLKPCEFVKLGSR
jgi:hypothetical protein